MTVGHEVGFVGEVVANRVCEVIVGHEAGYEVTVGHEVGFVGEVVANRFCVVTVGHEAGYEVTVGHGNGAMMTREPTMIVFMFVASNYNVLRDYDLIPIY